MFPSRYLSVVASVLTAALLGCAHVPADQPASAAGGAQNGSMAAVRAAPAGTSASTPQALPDVVSAQTVHDAELLGYHTEKRNGTTVFCKRPPPDTGSRVSIRQEQCVDQQNIASLVEQEQQQQQRLRACTAGPGCSQ
ncbi:MAG TPA: hypothetical protein VMD49_09650 [Steroidobacteraceae bacterium]|nr:hypothetical protein [Steroidobacteraceae bacterium]